jgi:hypothetical protein
VYYSDLYDLRLIHLRNPWGREQHDRARSGSTYVGRRQSSEERVYPSHESGEWQNISLLANACDQFRREDGAFWMRWDKALKDFAFLSVCLYQPDWWDYRVRGAFQADGTPTVAVLVRVSEPVKAFVGITLQNDRSLGVHIGAQTPIMVLANLSTNGRDFKFFRCTTDSPHAPSRKLVFFSSFEASMQIELQPGTTYLFVPRSRPLQLGGQLPFVFGMQTSKRMGRGNGVVEFLGLTSDVPLFRNFTEFALHPGTCSPAASTYQVRDPNSGRFSEQTGTEF